MSPHPASLPLRKWLLALASFCLLAATLPAASRASLPANPTFLRGISVGHWMAKMRGDQPYGGPWFAPDDVAWIAQQGFDHVRWPVDGRLWLFPDGSLDETKIARFLEAMAWARDNGMSSVLDMHFLPGGSGSDANNQDTAIFTDEPARAKAAEFWGKVTRRLQGEGAWLRFELVNEPMAPRNEQLNALNLVLLSAVRAVDSQRVVYLTSNLSSSFVTLTDLVVPDDPRVAIVLHYDEPMIFTHQRASWKQLPANMPPVNFPGTVPDLTKLVPPDHFAAKVSSTELKIGDVDAAFAKASAWLKTTRPARKSTSANSGVTKWRLPNRATSSLALSARPRNAMAGVGRFGIIKAVSECAARMAARPPCWRVFSTVEWAWEEMPRLATKQSSRMATTAPASVAAVGFRSLGLTRGD